MSHPLATKHRRRTSIVLGGVAAFSIVAALVLSRVPAERPRLESSGQPHHTAALPASSHVLGVNVAAPQYTLVVTSISLSQIDSTSQTRRVAIGVSLTNTSNAVLQLSPGLQMTLTDRSGTVYPFTAEYQPDTVLGGPVQPGSTSTLVADFKLPGNVTPAQFIYQRDAGTPATKVDL